METYLLFPGEDVLVEEELYLFVGDVDAQLLEGILGKVLETENVQNTDGQRLPAANFKKW